MDTKNGLAHGSEARSELDFCTVDGLFEGRAVPVIHDTGDRVWVGATFNDGVTGDVCYVGDGTGKNFDVDGNCVVSVPAELCTLMSEDEALGYADFMPDGVVVIRVIH